MKNKTWTVADENTLREFTKAGFDVDYISGELDRTHKSIFNRLSVMRERGEDLPRLASRKRRSQVKTGEVVDTHTKLNAATAKSNVLDSKTYDTEPPHILGDRAVVALLRKNLVEAHHRAASIQADLFIAQADLDNEKANKLWDLAIAFGFGLLAGVMGMGIWGVL